MGQSSSRNRRRDDLRQAYPQHASLPPPPPPSIHPYNPHSYSYRPNFSTAYYSPPPPSGAPYYYAYQQPQPSTNYGGLIGFLQSWVNSNFPSYYRPTQGNVWWTSAPPPPPGGPLPSSAMPPFSAFSEGSSSAVIAPPPYVEHQKAKTIKNDINLHKDTIRLEVDVENPEEHLVSFVYDAVVDGSFTIYYFASEETDTIFSTEDIYKPRTYSFEKGPGKRFCQPTGHGFDLGFFDFDSLSKPAKGDVFPLIIYAKAHSDAHSVQSAVTHAQATLAIIEKHKLGEFQVKTIKQILWIDGERYELQEIFGLVNSAIEPINGGDDDIGKECVICMNEPRNTAVFPCRHLCLCSDCAKSLRFQSNKCPLCRQPFEKLMEINVNTASSDT